VRSIENLLFIPRKVFWRTKAEVLGVFLPLPNECSTTTSLPNDAHLLLLVVDKFNVCSKSIECNNISYLRCSLLFNPKQLFIWRRSTAATDLRLYSPIFMRNCAYRIDSISQSGRHQPRPWVVNKQLNHWVRRKKGHLMAWAVID